MKPKAKASNAVRVTVGSVTLNIYPVTWRRRLGRRKFKRYKTWVAVHYFAGRRIRKKFTHLDKAKAHIKKIAEDLSTGHTALMSMTDVDRARWLHCKQLAEPTCKQPEILLTDAVAATQILGGRTTITRACEDWAQRNPAEIAPKTPTELLPDFIAAITSAGTGELHIKDRTIRLKRFARDFHCPLTAITGAEINTWLLGLRALRRTKPKPDGSPGVPPLGGPLIGKRSRNNYRDALREFFTWAKRVRALPRDWNELDAVKPATIKRKGHRPVWTPEEIRLLLTAARDMHEREEIQDMIPYLAIGAFAGPRSSELERIRFEKINWDAGVIPLNYEETKTNERRLVPIQPNLAAWLSPYQGKHGPICPYHNPYNICARIAKSAGLKWRKNALRYSSISYRLAITKDAAKVAEEHGNSEAEVKQSYQELVTEKNAKAYYNVTREDSNQKIMTLFGATG